MQVKAKFLCSTVVDTAHANGSNRKVSFHAVTSGSEENKSFAKYTPSGNLDMLIDPGTDAYNAFVPGKTYYLNIEEAGE